VPARHQVRTDADRAAIRAELPKRREMLRTAPTGLSVPVTRQSALDSDDDERRAHYEEYWASAGFGFLLAYGDLLTDRAATDTAAEFIRSKIAERVEDPRVREALTPRSYPYGAKRPCVDTGYYETFNRPNVTLVDISASPLAKVTETSLHTTTAEYELDVLIFATGFDAMTGALLNIDIRQVQEHTTCEIQASHSFEGVRRFDQTIFTIGGIGEKLVHLVACVGAACRVAQAELQLAGVTPRFLR